MKNREKYREEILNVENCDNFVKPIILKSYGIECREKNCVACLLKQMLWLDDEYVEPEKPLLTSKEREYLEGIIRPFKSRVGDITKYVYDDKQYISISVEREADIYLPYFLADTKYKGMIACREYTIEELGMFGEE